MMSGAAATALYQYSFHLIKRDLIPAAVVQFRRAGEFVRRDRLGILNGAPVLQGRPLYPLRETYGSKWNRGDRRSSPAICLQNLESRAEGVLLYPTAGIVVGPVQKPKPKRYHGTVSLDAARAGRDAGRIADEVITHLVGLVGSKVQVTLEIEAEIPEGASDSVVRTVTENGRTLKFTSNSGFETD